MKILLPSILLLLTVGATAICAEEDSNEAVLLSIAKHYKDPRTIDQIKFDNEFIRSASNGDVVKVREALGNGARVNALYIDGNAFLSAGISGYTALMRASISGHEAVVKLLIDAKADFNLEHKGRSSLFFAVKHKHDTIVKLLLDAGAKGDPKQMRLNEALIRAACKGFKIRDGEGYPAYPGSRRDDETAPDLATVLKEGADVNALDATGFTALMYAANLGLIDNVKLLLVNGADATLKSKFGDTALSMAERKTSLARREGAEIVKLLKEYLAR